MRIFSFLVICLFTSACDWVQGDKAHVHHSQLFAFGTIIEISLFEKDEGLVKQAEEVIKKDFEYMHRAYHPYEEGPLKRINSLLPLGAEFSIAPSVLPLIKRGIELEKSSDGYFNPAIGGLIQMWGFDRSESLHDNKPPKASEIAAFVNDLPGMKDLHLDGLSLSCTNKKVQLDLGGFAKGYGVNLVVEELKKLGVRNVILNAGGDLRALGSKGGKPWVIGIRHPRNKGVIASIDVSGDESVFTSGDYERFFEYEGKRYHHIINPKTGYPARDFQSVTIVHHDAALADAAATALFVAGKKDWRRIAKRMGIDQVMLIDQDEKVVLTPQLSERIKLLGVDPKNVSISEL
jgi:thiamine biosynthesis lipoprotein